MGKKGHGKDNKKKLTKKEKKAMNHLKLVQGKKSKDVPVATTDQKKKAAQFRSINKVRRFLLVLAHFIVCL